MKDSHTERVAAAVRAEMARRRVTQQTVADRLGITQMSVSRRLRGLTPFTAGEVLMVADLLGVDPATLMPSEPAA